ncbi:MAG: ATP-binding protein [Gammaproteobacteria bacterium]|nr:ATP-binding protein [Gammaproteobacteria bacterium]
MGSISKQNRVIFIWMSLSFAILMLLLATLQGHNYWQIKNVEGKLDEMVGNRNLKLQLSTDMLWVSYNRRTSVVNQLLSDDPFVRDEYQMLYHKWGFEVGEVRIAIRSLVLDDVETKLMEEQVNLVKQILVKQDYIVGLTQNDQLEEAREFLVSELSEMYYEFDKNVESLRSYERKMIGVAADDAALALSKANYFTLLLAVIVFIIALVIIVLTFTHIRKLSSSLLAQAVELENANDGLQQAILELKTAQAQLIQNEKMAALGQLVAGVAHEINSPLGAVKSSGRNISDAMEGVLLQLPQVLQLLSNVEEQLFFGLLKQRVQDRALLTTREERKLIRALMRRLAEAGLQDTRDAAETLVQLGVYAEPEPYLPLFQHKNAQLILNTIYNLSSIASNTHNINLAVERVTKIVFALKSFARFDQGGKKIESDLQAGLEMVLTIYNNQIKQGVELQCDYEQLEPVACYPDELAQVWTNLIHNALQAMDYKGVLRIALKKVDGFAVVSIADNGCGIPKALMGRIYQPFFTTKASGEGSGLGLDIVTKIIEKHGGEIQVDSIEGEGSEFRVYLPMESNA